MATDKKNDLGTLLDESFKFIKEKFTSILIISLPYIIWNFIFSAVMTVSLGFNLADELEQLSNIIKKFNELFGNIDWKDADKIRKVIAEEIPDKVAADTAYQNAMNNSDKEIVALGISSNPGSGKKSSTSNSGSYRWVNCGRN